MLEKDLMSIIRIQPSFGKHAEAVTNYCCLFGVSPLKIKAKKFKTLLLEMKTLFDAEEFVYQKRRYFISQAGIREALDITNKKNFETPLTNHNYLKSCMVTIAEKEASQRSKQNEKSLRQKEDALRNRVPDTVTREENLKQVGDILRKFGG